MTRERIPKPVPQVQRAPDAAPKTRVSSRPAPLAQLPVTLTAKPVSPAQLEIQRAQQLEVQRQTDLEVQHAAIQRAHDDRFTQARASQTAWHARGTKTLGVQRAVAEHARTARDASHTRAAFIAQRQPALLETLVAQRVEAEVCPALPVVQRQADLTLPHVAAHLGSQAAVQLARDPERLSSYAGFKNTGASLVKNFRTPGSSHTIPELASAIQRFREPMQRAAVEGAVYAAFGSHPTYPKQLQRALEERDSNLEVQRAAWQRELEPVAQRQALEEASGEGAAGMIESARGGGQPLPTGVRAMLEAKWNTDLSKVRVHTDSSAASISKKLNAKALTTGQDIFFGASTFNPTSLEGLQLIAHEAWHTVQQAGGLVQAGIDRSASLEVEARGKGAELSSGDVQAVSSAPATPSSGKESKAKRATRTASPTSGTPSTTQTGTRAARTSKTVQRSATPAPSSLTATSTRVAGNLEGLISSAPIFGAPVQRASDGTVIQRAWWNPFDWAAEGAKWLGAKFMDGLEFLGERGAKAFMEVFTAAAKPFGATGKHVLEALKGIGKSLLQVIANPGAFASNLIAGVKLGFGNFVTNAPKHLTGILGSWLGGNGIDLKFPTKLEPLPMLMALLSSLNLGWDSIRAKIAKQLGPKGNQAVALAEKSGTMLSGLSGGLHKNTNFTKDVMPTLKTEAVSGLKSAAQEGLIRAGINVLLKLIPGAGTISAIFDTVSVLVSKASAIASLVTSVTGSFAAIAAGNLSSAAVAIEKSLSGGMRVALDFVAKLAKIDTFIARVRGIIGKVMTKISSVADPIIAKAVKLIRPLLGKVAGGSAPRGKTPAPAKPGSSKPATAKPNSIKPSAQSTKTASPKPVAQPPAKKPIKPAKPQNAPVKIPDGPIGAKVRIDGDKLPHHVWLEFKNNKPLIMMASTPMNIIDQLKGLKAEARAHLDPASNDFKLVNGKLAAAGHEVGVGIAKMKILLQTRTGKPNPGATSNTVKALDTKKITGALEEIAKVTLQNIRADLQPAFPILARSNGGVLPAVGVHPLKATNRESHHVPAAELAEVIQGQYRAVAAQLSGNLAAPVKALHDDLVRHAIAIEPVTSTRGNGLTAILIHKDTHRECKLGNAVHKTFLADVIQKQIERDLQPGEKRVVMVITPKGKSKRIEVNPQNGAWQAFLKGVHDIAGVTSTRGSGELIEVTANDNALNEVAASITRRLQNAPAGGLAPSVAAIRTRINTVTRSAFAQARDNGVSAVRAALAQSTKDGDHAQHPAILSRVVTEADTIWGARVIQTL